MTVSLDPYVSSPPAILIRYRVNDNTSRHTTAQLSTMPWRLAITATLVVGKAVAADNCFWRSNNQINAIDWFACNNTEVTPGGAQLCCIQGSQCGQDSICLQNVSYYVGGCTDGSYGDSVCRTSCSEWSLNLLSRSSTDDSCYR
jgi:hypothetical protein